MKLPAVFGDVFGKKEEKKEVFASLLLDMEYVAAALWEMGGNGVPHILSTATETCSADTWEDRLNAIDDALAAVEDKAGTTEYAKTVLGLPSTYLTQSGEIAKEVRMEIKNITKELALKPIGFVSIHQALMYQLKKDEGVPPSVILLGLSHHSLSLSLYKVGELAAQKTVTITGDIAIQVEEVLKEFKDLEVLPARILLYGHDGKDLNETKSDLLKYPWTTRVNFLHFPKIEIVTPEEVVKAISLAGASELASEMNEEPIESEVIPKNIPEKNNEMLNVQSDSEGDEIEEGEEIVEEEKIEEPNVVVVDPSRFGFKKSVDVLEEVDPRIKSGDVKKRFVLPKITLPKINIGGLPSKIGIGVVVILLGLFLYWAIPHATVTVLESPKSISDSQAITINPTATVVDAATKIIPGKKQEQSVSEDKTIAVTGKKNVGDPAKGLVTLYNKTLNAQTLSKGAILSAGSLAFTLDVDVSIASASEDLGGRTYGKATVAVTASQIGANSNVASSTTFAVKGFSTDEMTGNNAIAFAGGSSKEISVVSRADEDALVAAAQKDLVDQAKQKLTVIEDTIQTTVTQKSFAQELDQQASQLSGKVTVTVSGISYSDDDIKTLLKAFIAKDIPQGFTLSESRTQVSLTKVVVKKDGTITATASIKTDAVPTLDLAAIRKNLAGKTIVNAEKYLHTLQGVAGMEVSFGMNFGKSRLPINAKNISIKFAIQ